MKTAIISLLILTSTLSLSANAPQMELKADIKTVTLYFDRAQVSHEAQVQVPTGVSTIVIPSLSRYLIPASLQVKGTGQFMIMNVNHRSNYIGSGGDSPAVEEIRNKIRELRQKVEEEKSALEFLDEKESFLASNMVMGGKTNAITTEQLKSYMEFWSLSMENTKAAILKKSRSVKEMELQISLLEKQIQQKVAEGPQVTSEIVLTLSADKPATGRINISYMVTNAGWYPSYDIRVDETDKPVAINYKANMYQNTGNDWNSVKLSFSNATPGLPGTLPVLYPNIINFPPPPQSIQIRGTSSKSARPAAAREVFAEMQMLDEEVMSPSYAVPVQISETTTGFTFDLAMSQTVLSNGQENQVEIQRLSSEAFYRYRTVPKQRAAAFLTAGISDWESLNLLAGSANIYFENTFTGTTMINPLQLTDTMLVSLGTDPGIIIKREKKKEFSATRLIGSNRIETRSWVISVRNGKKTAVSVTVTDQIPVSGNSEISVEALELSGGKLIENKGEVSWELQLKPGETKELILTYSVKYPKNRNLIIE